MRVPALAIAALLCTAACSHSSSSSASGGDDRGPSSGGPVPAALQPHVQSSTPSAQNGSVNGQVTSGAGAIVVLEPRIPQTYPEQTGPPIMDQAGQTFAPELLFVRTGQPVEFRNSDDTLHNVHVGNIDTKEPAFNVAIPTGEKYTYTFQKDGFYHVGCDIHPAMSAEIFAVSTPFVRVAEADGRFSFADVPPGAYTVRAFSRRGRLQRDIEVRSGLNEVRVE